MPFVETHDFTTTRKRTSDSYVKFSPDHRVVLRMLNTNARLAWKHWIPEANAGRGLMANCPNNDPRIKICPIEKSLVGRERTDDYVIQRRAKKRYMVNVLDRTPFGACPSCNTQTPKAKNCQSCGASLPAKVEYSPLNKVKILEGGPQLFETTLNAVEKMQKEDFPAAEINDYDIVFTTQGTGRDRKISAIPQAPEIVDDVVITTPNEWLLDPETGEPQKLFDLDLLIEPTPVQEIEAMLAGATIEELNAIRGVS